MILQQYESDNSTSLPDQVKVAVLMNRTKRTFCNKHLHLNAGASTIIRGDTGQQITEYQRAHTTFSRLQQNPSSAVSSSYNGGTAPMDIGAISKGKHKGKGKGKHKGKKGKKGNKGKGLRKLRSTPTGKLQLTVNKRKRKDWTRNAFQRTTWQRKRKVLQQVNRTRKKDKSFATSVDNQGHTMKNL